MAVVVDLHEWRSLFILKFVLVDWDYSTESKKWLMTLLKQVICDSLTWEYRRYVTHSNSNANALELFCEEVLDNEDEFQITVWKK